ncbi:MAG: thiamine pyrophosphate-dependent dehydrogenase E1 component subunit alpha [Pseudomonadota bacterium]
MARGPSKKIKLSMYRALVLARRYEEELINVFKEGKIPGWIHSGLGQEATGVALGECLDPSDYLVPYFRSRASLLSKGMSLQEMTAEIFGRTTGCCAGRGGEGHLASKELGILGAGGVIGSPIAISVGLGYAAKLKGQGQVVACGFGDGATSRGAFHESVNMASVLQLPIVFICENNLYSEFSDLPTQMRIHDVALRAQAYGIEGVTVDGNDPVALYPVLRKAFDNCRQDKGPTLIEAKTYRVRGHYEGDPCKYRSEDEFKHWLQKDPLLNYQQRLLEEGVIDQAYLEQVEQEVRGQIQEAMAFAMDSPKPTPSDVVAYVYA